MTTTTMPPSLASSLSSSFSSTGRGTLLVGVAYPSTIEALFISLRGKKGGKKLIRSCNKTTLLQGDVTQLTTIYTHTIWINNPITLKSLFVLSSIFIFPTMLAYCSFYVIGKKWSLYMCMYWKLWQWMFKRFLFDPNFNFFVNSQK